MSELKPCPFCGSEVRTIDCEEYFEIRCEGSDCIAKTYDDKQAALEHWNTRAEHPELTALREQVKVLTRYLLEAGHDTLRLIATVQYLRGIAERGTGRLCDDNETTEQFVLGYVKELEGQVKVLREALGWLVNEMDCRDDEFGGCLFTQQDFKIAREALEQTKPKGEMEAKL